MKPLNIYITIETQKRIRNFNKKTHANYAIANAVPPIRV